MGREAFRAHLRAAVDGSDEQDSKARWFAVTAAYGLAYGALYAATGHRLVAPVCAHAGLNIGLCARDWQRMRNTPAAKLRATFGIEIS